MQVRQDEPADAGRRRGDAGLRRAGEELGRLDRHVFGPGGLGNEDVGVASQLDQVRRRPAVAGADERRAACREPETRVGQPMRQQSSIHGERPDHERFAGGELVLVVRVVVCRSSAGTVA
jgi:hypothetical protein